MNLPLNTNLTGKVAVVTGAAGTLCSVFSKALAASGAKVALLGRTYANVQKLAEEIAAEGGTAKAYECNVLDKAAVMACHEQVLADFGPCDILINGAGGNHPDGTTGGETFLPEPAAPFSPDGIQADNTAQKNRETAALSPDKQAASPDGRQAVQTAPNGKTFFELEPEAVGFVFDLNFLGVFLSTQVFTADMTKGGGCIINISSMNAYRPLTKILAYSAAKAAVSNFTQWLAVHFAPCGIRVNAIAPGFFATAQNKSLLFEPNGELSARSKKIISHTPMGRFGTPKDLLGALRFLTDDNASGFITGITLPVDGGFSAYSGV